MKNVNTVGELIKKLGRFPNDMPVRIAVPEGREGEYRIIGSVKGDHLENQNTDGDPEEYWNDPDELEPEDRLQKGDIHFKYQGSLCLIS